MKNYLKRLVEKYRFKKIKTRFLAALIALTVPPIFLTGVIAYNISSDSLVDTHIQAYEQQLKTFNKNIEMVFVNIIKMNRYILSNEEIRDQLIEREKSRAEAQRTSNKLQQIMFEYLIENRHVESICLMDKQFRFVCYGRSDNAGVYNGKYKVLNIMNSNWYQQAVQAEGKEVFLNYNVLEPSRKHTFSSVKRMLDPEDMSLEPLGILIVNMNKSMFEEVLNNNNESNGLLIVKPEDNDLETVYSSNDYLNKLAENHSLSEVYDELTKEGYVYSQFTNEETGWRFIHTIPEDILLQESHQIRTVTFFIAGLIAASAIVMSLYISDTITKPLRKIKGMIVRWALGQREFTEKYRDDEIGEIGETFKQMAAENRDLGERLTRSQLKQRETELRVLQAQINPHFLYNTMDTIYWMAIIQNHQDIAKMSIALSESFKIILSKGKETITVKEELKHIDHYMTIQKFRHKEKIYYHSEVDPEIMDLPILKLLLQPIVENAIYHGLEKKVGHGSIILSGKKIDRFVVFHISDNGVGIEDRNVIKNGYGIGNIQERLQLYYGEDCSFKIKSAPQKGTSVEIKFDPEKGRRSDTDESHHN
ncbi:sensor histidine kinase [Halobacillus naozhouensis]|uniref:Sensor histidine kinase n=1 Tax=Halobacillus naozhouensis TaxID=554880 RepID=A0ABY8IYN4_9BACI|nr:sensor histidine kinase [Halobacillus naozhouensis]WFT75315.1 sensor histidine kinase [Halobacillus naozhouensis]